MMPTTTTVNKIPYPVDADGNDTVQYMAGMAVHLDQRIYSAGDIKMSIRVTAETGWAKVNGQTITNAQSNNPDFWAVIPTAWKSGSNAILPNWSDGYVLRGSDEAGGVAIGASSGANTVTLTTANMPLHNHTINHGHTYTGNATGGSNHRHSVDHDHAAFNTGSGGSHGHVEEGGGGAYGWLYISAPGGGTFDVYINSGVGVDRGSVKYTQPSTGTGGSSHIHTIDVPNYTGLSGFEGDHVHTTSGTVAAHNGNSGDAGSGSPTAVSVRGKSGGINYFIKL